MSWNFRVIVERVKIIGGQDELSFAIHEVYYDKEGKPNGMTKNSVNVSSDTPEGLAWYLDNMKDALHKPFIWGGDKFPEEYKKELKE